MTFPIYSLIGIDKSWYDAATTSIKLHICTNYMKKNFGKFSISPFHLKNLHSQTKWKINHINIICTQIGIEWALFWIVSCLSLSLLKKFLLTWIRREFFRWRRLSDFAVFWNLSASFSRLLLNSSHVWNQKHIEEVLFNAGPALGFWDMGAIQ